MNTKKLTRIEICQLSSLLYRAEKFDLIIEYSKELIKENPVLTEREEQVFYEGYKYKISKELISFSKLKEIEKKEKNKKKRRAKYIVEIIDPIKKNIIDIANDFDKQVDIVIQKAQTYSNMVNYIQWKLDFIRYKCQCLDKINDEQLLKEENQKFEQNFAKGEDLVKAYLKEDDQVSLKLQLSKAIYLYEVLDDDDSAKKLAFSCMDIINKSENKKYLYPVYQALKDNFIIWSKKSQEELGL